MAKQAIVVKTYKNESEYQKDANRMRAEGYEVQTMDQAERSGCMRWLLVGPLALVWKKHQITVTYRLAEQATDSG